MRPSVFIAVAALAANTLVAQAKHTAPQFNWGPAPAIFPAGAKMAVLQGDPSKPELFTVRLDFPNGYKLAPHTHPTEEGVTIIKGTFLVGMGSKWDQKSMMTLETGGFGTVGANMAHYAIARGRTIVQVHSMGPFALIYVNPADDPTKTVSAKK